MRRLRKQILWLSPHLLWCLAIGLGYSMLGYAFVGDAIGIGMGMGGYYLRGLVLLLPLVGFAYAAKKAAHIWQFVLFSVLLLGALQLAFASWFFTGIAIVICLLRGGNRIRQQLQMLEEELPTESPLDHPGKFLLLLPVLYFLVAGNQNLPLFQALALYHFVAMSLLFFVQGGLLRFEAYVALSELNANVPSARILETGTRIFVASALLLTLLLVPIIRSFYQFTPIVFERATASEWVEEAEEEAVEESDHVSEIYDSIAESEPMFDLSWLWAILDKVAVVLFWGVSVYFLYRCLNVIIVNFNKTQVEKNDVIESTFLDSEAQLYAQRTRARFAALFDFSKAMKTRRRYQKELKKHHPKPWQTPTEMEAMAQKNIPELHAAYEAARYGNPDWR